MGNNFLITWKIIQFSTRENQFQSEFYVLEDIKVHFVLYFLDNDPKSYIQTTFYGLTSEICPKIDFEITNFQDKSKTFQNSQKAIFTPENHRHTFSFPISYNDIKTETNGFLQNNSDLTLTIKVFYKAPISMLSTKVNLNEITTSQKKRRLSSDFIYSSSLQSPVKSSQALTKDDSITLSKRSSPISKNSKITTGYVGLQNQGATCYMNSMLQSLFHTPAFRRLVFQIPTTGKEDETKSITLNLQRLFCRLQIGEQACPTTGLTRSFGWTSGEVFMQHDVQEFCRVLMDNLEGKLKNTELSNKIPDLFRGESRNCIRCINVPCESIRNEYFYDLPIQIKGCNSLEDSFKKYIAKEKLEGSNQYSTDNYGKQDAEMGTEFLQFPKVLHLHLKRFDFDYNTLRMEKVNDKFEFPKQIDLSPFLVSPEPGKSYLYDLYGILIHYGGVYGGHYYAYLRTTTEQKWFKFNDSCVTIEDEKAAIDDNFGGDGKMYSAYMLVYVSHDSAEEVYKHVSDDEIPIHLKEYVKKVEEEEKIEREEIKRQANTIYVSSLSEEVIEINCLTGRYGYKPLFEEEKIPFQKDASIDFLYDKLASQYNKKASQIRLWETNYNRTPVRLVKPSNENNLASLNTTSTQMLDFFVQFKDENEPVEIEEGKIMVYVKFFLPKKEAPFQYLGHFCVPKSETIKKSLFERVCDHLGCPYFFKETENEDNQKIQLKQNSEEEKINLNSEGFSHNMSPSEAPLPPPPPPPPPPPSAKVDSEKMFVYQELLNMKTKKLDVNETFVTQGIGNGAILVFQVAPNVSNVPKFAKIQIKKPLDADSIIREKQEKKEAATKKEQKSSISEKVKNLSSLLNQPTEKVEDNKKEDENDDLIPKVDFMKYSKDFQFDTVDTYINIFSNIADIDVYDLEKAEKPLFRLHISTFLSFGEIKRIIAKEAHLDYDPLHDSMILYKGTSPDKLPTNPMDQKMYKNPRSYFVGPPSSFKMKHHRLYFHMNHQMSEDVASNSSQFTVQFASDGYNVGFEKKVISEKKSTCIRIFQKAITSNFENFDVKNLRFISIYDHKISSILSPDQEFGWSYYTLRVDVIPDDQKVLEEGQFLLPVTHGYTDVAFYTHSKGNPSLFKVLKDEEFGDSKKRLLKLLKWDDQKIDGFNGQFKLNVDTKTVGKEIVIKDDDCLSKIASVNSLLYIVAKEDMNIRTYNVGSRAAAQPLRIYN